MYSLYEQDDMRNKFGNNAYDFAVAKFEQRGLFEHIFLIVKDCYRRHNEAIGEYYYGCI